MPDYVTYVSGIKCLLCLRKDILLNHHLAWFSTLDPLTISRGIHFIDTEKRITPIASSPPWTPIVAQFSRAPACRKTSAGACLGPCRGSLAQRRPAWKPPEISTSAFSPRNGLCWFISVKSLAHIVQIPTPNNPNLNVIKEGVYPIVIITTQ